MEKAVRGEALSWFGLGVFGTAYFAHWLFSAAPEEPFPADLTGRMPSDERVLIDIVGQLADSYRSAPNEMAQGAARATRRTGLEYQFRDSTGAGKWLGYVTTLSSTSSGKGVLTVKIADHISVGTMNNEISDSMTEHTLLEPGTPLFSAAVNLHVGERVVFSGAFVLSATDYYEEDSMTQQGSMTNPEFLFAFTDIAPTP